MYNYYINVVVFINTQRLFYTITIIKYLISHVLDEMTTIANNGWTNLILSEMLINKYSNKKELHTAILKSNPQLESHKLWTRINSTISFLNKYAGYKWNSKKFKLGVR